MNWKELNIKEKLAIITAIAAFIVGWGLTIAAFIVPPLGEIGDSVLFVLGQALVYCASVFGITSFFSVESKRMRDDVNRMINDERRRRDEGDE